jgi:hypothetical protein
MNAARHKKKETAYKGILILISLVLFFVRLSDKFYLSSNRPYFNSAAKSSVHKTVLTVKTGLSKKCSFHPDKRYHPGNSFALLITLNLTLWMLTISNCSIKFSKKYPLSVPYAGPHCMSPIMGITKLYGIVPPMRRVSGISKEPLLNR